MSRTSTLNSCPTESRLAVTQGRRQVTDPTLSPLPKVRLSKPSTGDTVKLPPESTSDVSPVYRRINDWFDKNYPGARSELYKRIVQAIDRNYDVAEILRNMGLVTTATKLDACHRVQVSNSLPEFKSETYCCRTLLCWHCSRVKSMKRADQIMEACLRFSNLIASNRLMSHRFIIAPDMSSATGDPFRNLQRSVALLMAFRCELKCEHDHRRYPDRVGGDKLKAWGPTVNAIHVVPRYAGKNTEPFAHMHLTVTTSIRSSKKEVTATVTDLFNSAKAECGVGHRATKPEIIRESKYFRPAKSDTADWLDDEYEDRDVPAGSRFGAFSPHETRASCELFNRTIGYFKYLSHFVKNRWEPSTVVQHVRLLEELEVEHKSLQQFLGKEGTTLQKMPTKYLSSNLRQKFKATYQPTGDWNIERLIRAGDYSSATST